MNAAQIIEAIRDNPGWAVFVNVLLQQVGLPVPAVPTLMVAGSLTLSSTGLAKLVTAAVLASVTADLLWYQAGRVFGYRVLSGLCRLSINPGSCVSETEARFIRWGVWSLVIAKFVPGFSIVAPPIAGSLRMSPLRFIAAAGLGAGLWAAIAIGAGWYLREKIQASLDAINQHATEAIGALVIAVVLWLGWKFWQKYRFERMAAIPHILPEDLVAILQSSTPLLLLDLRGGTTISQAGSIAGATPADLDSLPGVVVGLTKHHQIVTFCACPGDATAVSAATKLIGMGFSSVRPLKGGYEGLRSHLAQLNE